MLRNFRNLRKSLQWPHNGRDSVLNHQPHDCLLNGLFRRRSKKHESSASLAFVQGIHRGPVNSPAQMASYAENVSIWWRQYVLELISRPSSTGQHGGIFYIVAQWVETKMYSINHLRTLVISVPINVLEPSVARPSADWKFSLDIMIHYHLYGPVDVIPNGRRNLKKSSAVTVKFYD